MPSNRGLTIQGCHVSIGNLYPIMLGFPGGSEDKASACNAGDLGLIPGLGRSPGEGNGNPLQYSCLENPMDRGAWRARVHRVAKSRTQLSDFTHWTFTRIWQNLQARPDARCLVPHRERKRDCFARQLYRVHNQQNFTYFYFHLIPGQIEETSNIISQNRRQTLSFWHSPLVYNACLVCQKANN